LDVRLSLQTGGGEGLMPGLTFYAEPGRHRFWRSKRSNCKRRGSRAGESRAHFF
jgi:hypothetical protein